MKKGTICFPANRIAPATLLHEICHFVHWAATVKARRPHLRPEDSVPVPFEIEVAPTGHHDAHFIAIERSVHEAYGIKASSWNGRKSRVGTKKKMDAFLSQLSLPQATVNGQAVVPAQANFETDMPAVVSLRREDAENSLVCQRCRERHDRTDSWVATRDSGATYNLCSRCRDKIVDAGKRLNAQPRGA